jgi:hypothetical protein
LTDPTDGAVTALQDEVRFAATTYHSVNGNRGGTCPILARSAGMPAGEPKLGNRDAIDDLLRNNAPTEDTPTAESVREVAAGLLPYRSDIDGVLSPLVLLLATDGNPDNCEDPDAHNLQSQQMSESAVQEAFTAGVTTYALSVGSDVSDTHLAKLANAGVGKPLDPPDAPFFRGNDPAELVAAIRQIVYGVRSCTFTLSGRVVNPATGTVVMDAMTLAYGTDWTLSGETTLELLGEACERFLNDDTVSLTATFACGGVVID